MTEWAPDPDAPYPEGDKDVLARAHRALLAEETPIAAYLRQQWQCAIAATKVAKDAAHKLFPEECVEFGERGIQALRYASQSLDDAYAALHDLEMSIMGEAWIEASRGCTHEDLDGLGVPRVEPRKA